MTTTLIARETIAGIEPPVCILRSPTRILVWRDLGAGQVLDKQIIAERHGINCKSATRVIIGLLDAGVAHVKHWTRPSGRGPWSPAIAFGPGKDAELPGKMSNAEACARWRTRHPERYLQCDRNWRIRQRARQGKMPRGNDPLLAAIMGVRA